MHCNTIGLSGVAGRGSGEPVGLTMMREILFEPRFACCFTLLYV